ncbi:iron-containing alcohol dehydrogenase [candidate division KSB1 bacterium]|nr:iron-containing alcohol dehydrogenase [candidate division KSB1 bacterium]
MQNFTYYNPVRIVFGRNSIARLPDLIDAQKRILFLYGGGSIRKNGVYDQVRQALQGRALVEFAGIEPNPRYETLMRAVALAKTEKIDFLLAVGGGSVLDGSKFVAAAVRFAGKDPWDILNKQAPVRDALPLGTVLTLPATGSEMNGFAVISRDSSQEKLAFGSEKVYPRFSILDPAVTQSLPRDQVANGIVDTFVHVMEQYMTFPVNAPLQDRQAEAIWLTLIERAPAILKEPVDLDERAVYMWCATQALNGLIGCGVPQDWTTHQIGHELTAFYGIAHAPSLALVLPAVLRSQRDRKKEKLHQYGERVWGIRETGTDSLDAAIDHTRDFFESLGVPVRLKDYNITDRHFSAIVDRFSQRGSKLGEHGDISSEKVAEILQMIA